MIPGRFTEDHRSPRVFIAPFMLEPERSTWRGLEQTLWKALTNWLHQRASGESG